MFVKVNLYFSDLYNLRVRKIVKANDRARRNRDTLKILTRGEIRVN